MNPIVIWQPKFSTKEVLVAKLAIKPGKNYLYFCCDRNYPDLYSFDSAEAKAQGKYCSNGKIVCLAFPLELLTNEGPLPEEYIPNRDKEYNKFKKTLNKK